MSDAFDIAPMPTAYQGWVGSVKDDLTELKRQMSATQALVLELSRKLADLSHAFEEDLRAPRVLMSAAVREALQKAGVL